MSFPSELVYFFYLSGSKENEDFITPFIAEKFELMLEKLITCKTYE